MARLKWLSEDQGSTLIDDYAKNMESFVDAISDGHIDEEELAQQERRLVEMMKEVEPTLDDKTHQKITQLLCEMSAFSTMQAFRAIWESRPKTTFRG